MLGKINVIDLLASHPFFGGWGTDRFWNVAFVAPPTGVLPPVIMGGILTHSLAPYSLTAMVFDPNDRTTN
jgi:porin